MTHVNELEECCQMVISAGLSTGHAESHIELMTEVLSQCVNASPNVEAQSRRIAELEECWRQTLIESYDLEPLGGKVRRIYSTPEEYASEVISSNEED